MPRPAFSRLQESQRDAILEGAGAMFAARGYESTSYNRVIQEVGVSKGAMYHYFVDKADLFQTLIDDVTATFLDYVRPRRRLLSVTMYWQEVWQICAQLLEFLSGKSKRHQLLWWIVCLPEGEASHPALRAGHNLVFESVTSMVRIGQGIGAVQTELPPRVIGQVVFGVLDGLWRGGRLEPEEGDASTDLTPRVGTMFQLIRRVGLPMPPDLNRDEAHPERRC